MSYGVAVVAMYYSGLYVQAAHVGRCVEMCYESYCGHFPVGDVAGKCGHKVAVVVERYVFKTHFLQFGMQMSGKHHLAGGGRGHVGEFVALSVESYVVEESVNKIHILRYYSFQSASISRHGRVAFSSESPAGVVRMKR